MPHMTHVHPPSAKSNMARAICNGRANTERSVESLRLKSGANRTASPCRHRVVDLRQPANVCPAETHVASVGIALGVRMRVMLAMRRDPPDGIALQRQRAEDRKRVLERFSHSQSAMRQGPVVAQCDAQAARKVQQNRRDDRPAPMKRAGQKRRQRADVDAPATRRGSSRHESGRSRLSGNLVAMRNSPGNRPACRREVETELPLRRRTGCMWL